MRTVSVHDLKLWSASPSLSSTMIGMAGRRAQSSAMLTPYVVAVLLIVSYLVCMLAESRGRMGGSGNRQQRTTAAAGERRCGAGADASRSPLEELTKRGLLSSIRRQRKELCGMISLLQRESSPVAIEATGDRGPLQDGFKEALLTYHRTWEEIIAVCDKLKGPNITDRRFKYCLTVPYNEDLQRERISALEFLLEHLPKVRPAWWRWASRQEVKAHDELVKGLKEELECRGVAFRSSAQRIPRQFSTDALHSGGARGPSVRPNSSWRPSQGTATTLEHRARPVCGAAGC